MIAGIFHEGSGLGNQLHRYVGSRVMALDKGEEHCMVAPHLFKGYSFMDLEINDSKLPYHIEYPAGKVVVREETDIKIVDGEFQGWADFGHRLDEIREWLKVEPLEMADDVCVMAFRGGEYVGVKDLFLPLYYWTEAMMKMREKYPDIKFHVVTDDVQTAQVFFMGLDLTIGHEIGHDWRKIRYAKHLILSNSSFGILPALLGDAKEIIAPEFWAGYNTGEWIRPENKYERFTYI